jgi:hypothetical protein
MPCEAYPCVWMALLGVCRLHGNMGLGEACVRNVVCYVIYIVASEWDLNKIVEEAWNRFDEATVLVPYYNFWQVILCSNSFVLTFHHSSSPLNLRLSLRHQATMRI